MTVMRLLAKRSDTVWLLTDDTNNPPETARVLDLEQLKLFPSYNYQSILARGYWEAPPDDAPSAEQLLEGIDNMAERARGREIDPGDS